MPYPSSRPLDHQFGMPNRITATTAFGKGEVMDIEH